MSLEKDAVHFCFGQLKHFSQGVLRPPLDRLYAQIGATEMKKTWTLFSRVSQQPSSGRLIYLS